VTKLDAGGDPVTAQGDVEVVWDGKDNGLQGTTFTPTTNVNGAQTITMTIDDQGNSGGGPLSDTDPINLSLTAVNDAPVITRPTTVNRGGGHGIHLQRRECHLDRGRRARVRGSVTASSTTPGHGGGRVAGSGRR
jgi:hypothetical protein